MSDFSPHCLTQFVWKAKASMTEKSSDFSDRKHSQCHLEVESSTMRGKLFNTISEFSLQMALCGDGWRTRERLIPEQPAQPGVRGIANGFLHWFRGTTGCVPKSKFDERLPEKPNNLSLEERNIPEEPTQPGVHEIANGCLTRFQTTTDCMPKAKLKLFHNASHRFSGSRFVQHPFALNRINNSITSEPLSPDREYLMRFWFIWWMQLGRNIRRMTTHICRTMNITSSAIAFDELSRLLLS